LIAACRMSASAERPPCDFILPCLCVCACVRVCLLLSSGALLRSAHWVSGLEVGV